MRLAGEGGEDDSVRVDELPYGGSGGEETAW